MRARVMYVHVRAHPQPTLLQEHHDQEEDNNTIHRPRVFSVRPQLTGTTSAVLKKKAAEKQAKQDEKDHNHIPLTEEEKESKRIMADASHKRMREKVRAAPPPHRPAPIAYRCSPRVDAADLHANVPESPY